MSKTTNTSGDVRAYGAHTGRAGVASGLFARTMRRMRRIDSFCASKKSEMSSTGTDEGASIQNQPERYLWASFPFAVTHLPVEVSK